MDRLLLIDGHSILNRAFYGLPDLTNANGLHTNAIYGFLNIMFKIMDEEKPTHFAVAFDVHQPTFRHEIYKEYKGTRKPMPEELRQQVPVMKEVLNKMGVLVMEKGGLEADDILGTMAKRGEKAGFAVSLVSGDRDLLQIASDVIKIRIPKTKFGKTTVEDYYAKDVLAAYQVTPTQFIDLKALMGDTADNIPGVPKVGEKTATELMVQYGSLENIYANVESITKKAIKQSLIDNKDLADLSKVLATINIDADIEYTFEDAVLGNIFTSEAYDMYRELEFKNLLSRFDKTNVVSLGDSLDKVIRITDVKTFEKVEADVLSKENVAIRFFVKEGTESNTEENGQLSLFSIEGREKSVLLAFSTAKETTYFVSSDDVSFDVIRTFIMKLYNSDIMLIVYDVKELYRILEIRNTISAEACKNVVDLKIGAYLINPLKNDYSVDDISKEHTGNIITSYEEEFGKIDIFDAYKEKERFEKFVCNEAFALLNAWPEIERKLDDTCQKQLFYDIEMPVSYVLYEMEREGMLVNRSALKEYGDELKKHLDVLESQIYEEAGKEFNINSPKQLGEILFDEMKIPGGKKTKTGYSTSAEVLEKLAPDYPLVKDVLEYRTYAKLKSTYADGLNDYISDDGRIHSNFNQTITATGRISSTEPNLQNIPMRIELGRKIRKVFIPRDGYILADADYSQIELRILAALAGDESLINAFLNNQDIHQLTASKVFHVPFEEVTSIQRRNAKAVNFGIVYGISSFGLAEDLGISRSEAKQYIDEYFATYPSIKKYLDKTKEDAKDNGYCVTAYNRRRPIPELKSSNFMQRQFGERVAMNAPIQGTAADIMKIAMIRVYDRIVRENLRSRLILQVHDELVIETANDEKDKVMNILVEEMSGAASLSVKLDVSACSGINWYEAKD